MVYKMTEPHQVYSLAALVGRMQLLRYNQCQKVRLHFIGLINTNPWL